MVRKVSDNTQERTAFAIPFVLGAVPSRMSDSNGRLTQPPGELKNSYRPLNNVLELAQYYYKSVTDPTIYTEIYEDENNIIVYKYPPIVYYINSDNEVEPSEIICFRKAVRESEAFNPFTFPVQPQCSVVFQFARSRKKFFEQAEILSDGRIWLYGNYTYADYEQGLIGVVPNKYLSYWDINNVAANGGSVKIRLPEKGYDTIIYNWASGDGLYNFNEKSCYEWYVREYTVDGQSYPNLQSFLDDVRAVIASNNSSYDSVNLNGWVYIGSQARCTHTPPELPPPILRPPPPREPPPPPPPPRKRRKKCECDMTCCPQNDSDRNILARLIKIQGYLETPISGEITYPKKDKDKGTTEIIKKVIQGGIGLAGLGSIEMAIINFIIELLLEELGKEEEKEPLIPATPDAWEIKLQGGTPQLAIMYANKVPGANYLGRDRRGLHIPHYKHGKGQNIKFPKYKKGSYYACITLSDNSKIVCNAINTKEASRVVYELLQHVKDEYKKNVIYTDGKRKGAELKEFDVEPITAAYYSKGQKQVVPDWINDLRP